MNRDLHPLKPKYHNSIDEQTEELVYCLHARKPTESLN